MPGRAHRILFRILVAFTSLMGFSFLATFPAQARCGGPPPADIEWSPDGRQIAFTSTRDGDADIYVMNADGSDLRNISNTDDTDDYYFKWSPDSRWLLIPLFNPSKVLLVAVDGSTRINLTESPYYIRPINSQLAGAFSPDGTRFAFQSAQDGDIYIMNTDGSQLSKLAAPLSPGDISGLYWSPDGSRIAYEAGSAVPGIIEVDTGNTWSLVKEVCTDCWYHLSWQPNGSKILVRQGYKLLVVDVLTKTRFDVADQLGFEDIGYLSWSPDGSRILVFHDGLHVMSADGSDHIHLTKMSIPPIEWSPDGTQLLDWQLKLFNADGSGVRQLPGPGGPNWGTWSPDGNKIAIQGRTLLFIVNTDGSDLHDLPRKSLDFGSTFDWSPDSEQIALNDGGHTISIYSAREANGEPLFTLTSETKTAYGYLIEGIELAFQGNSRQAINRFSAAIEIDAEYALAYLGRAIEFDKLGDEARALEDFWQYVRTVSYTEPQDFVGGIESTGPEITYRIPINPSIVQLIHFQAEAGQLINITAEPAGGGDVDPLLVLTDADDNPVAADDDGGGDLKAYIQNYLVPADGVYTLYVTHAGGGNLGAISIIDVIIRFQNRGGQ
jgi:Tol biopolymer transport system component